MAEDVMPVHRADRARKSGYHFRFSLVYALLAAVAAASIAALVVVVTRPDAAKAQNWSKFEPSGSAIARTRQIATRVSAEYKLQPGHKLAAVLAWTEIINAKDRIGVANIKHQKHRFSWKPGAHCPKSQSADPGLYGHEESHADQAHLLFRYSRRFRPRGQVYLLHKMSATRYGA